MTSETEKKLVKVTQSAPRLEYRDNKAVWVVERVETYEITTNVVIA